MNVKIVANFTHLEYEGHFLKGIRFNLDSRMPNSGHEFLGFNDKLLYTTLLKAMCRNIERILH